MRSLYGIFIFIFCVFLSHTVLAAPSSRIVAVVNGEMISSVELDKRAKPLLDKNNLKVTDSSQKYMIEALYKQVLDQMIQETLLLQAAKTQHINISDENLNAQLDAMIKQSQLSSEEYYKQAATHGVTPEMIKQELKTNIIIQQVMEANIGQKVVVTDNEITAYFNEHKNAFAQGTQYHLALIIYPTDEDALSFSQQIFQGTLSFSEVARKISVGPNPQQGGDLGTMVSHDIAPALLQVLETLNEGQNSQLIDMQYNKAQVRLIEKNTVSLGAELNDATKMQIEAVIREPRLEARFNEYFEQLRKKAIIDIRL